MLLTATQEDKSLQHSVNLLKQFHEEQGIRFQQKESKQFEEEKATDAQIFQVVGRSKIYKSKLPKIRRRNYPEVQ
ncbi:hypothetical protein EZS27_028278 [termite gut metagenome]|uniref:Uncharacterized protein n=1 Tax=termite gut metagenome TaxID=433724 RepID=A0A5J4QJV4_9ZZZZ